MENYYENGRVKVITATEENAYETEVTELENKEVAVRYLKEVLRSDYWCDVEEIEGVPESCHFTSADGYHILALIVESRREEEEELDNIYDEWRKPMIDEMEGEEYDEDEEDEDC